MSSRSGLRPVPLRTAQLEPGNFFLPLPCFGKVERDRHELLAIVSFADEIALGVRDERLAGSAKRAVLERRPFARKLADEGEGAAGCIPASAHS